MNRFISTGVLVLSLALTGSAQTAWNLDRSHTAIKFSVRHMLVYDVEGNFKEFTLAFASDKEDHSDATLGVTIQTASINTDNERRDGDLRSPNFFESEKFPTITFKSTKFEKTGENIYKIYGDLTVRDVTKPVVFDAVHGGIVKTSRGIVSGWKATLTINRFDFGLKWDRAVETGGLVVGKDVTITVNAAVRK